VLEVDQKRMENVQGKAAKVELPFGSGGNGI
jgi:hypothetical protein